MNFKVEIIDNLHELNKLEFEWNKLNSSCSNNSFLSFAWSNSWAQWLKDEYEFFIVIVRDEDQKLVGVAPLGISINKRLGLNIRVLSFFTDRPSDYQDFIVINNNEEIVTIIINTIFIHKNKWDIIELLNFASDSPVMSSILQQKKLKFRSRICAYCPRILFDEDGIDFDSIIAKKTRQDIIYQIRRMEKTSPLELHKVENEFEIEDFMNSFCELHKKRWNGTSTKSLFNETKFKSFFVEQGKKMYIERMASCTYLTYEGKMVAAHYGFRSKSSFFYYYPAYDTDYAKNSIGKVFLYLLIKSEADDDLKVFDFLRGNEEYKKNWGSKVYNNIQITSVKFNLKGWITLFDWYYNKNRKFFIFRVYRKMVKQIDKIFR